MVKETMMADRVGQQLGNYRLVRLLGQGGFAEVYLGEHIYLDTSAAIKVLRAELDSDEVEHFHAEARTIARLVHPHIVRVLEFGVEHTTPFLVVDYAPNGTLRKKHVRGVPLPLSTVVGYVKQIAEALQYAHDQKVIHRDIKPENMLLGRRNEVLISDFGIALVIGSLYHSTRSAQDLVGTIAYMAPEQIQSQAFPASDQYALGVVVYEWLSGTRPFQGSFTEIAVKHALASPPLLRERIPGVSTAVEGVVMRALAKDPQRRYASIQDFALALEQAYQREPTAPTSIVDTTVPPAESSFSTDTVPFSIQVASSITPVLSSPQPSELHLPTLENPPLARETTALEQPSTTALSPGRQPRGISRRTALLGLIGAAAATAVGGGAIVLLHISESQGPFSSSPASIHKDAALYTYRGHVGYVWCAAWSPNNGRIASASSDKTVQVWDATSGDNPYTYTGHADSVYAVTWSPDGSRIASASYDKTVQVWDAVGGNPYTYSRHSSWVWSVAWSPDGRRIASAGGDKTVQVWDATNGRPLYTYRGHTDSVFSVAWSPNSKYIASTGADGTVQVWNATNGNTLYLYRPYSGALIWSVAWSPDGRRIASASGDKTVQVWDATSGDHLYIYYGQSDSVYTVAWSPNGNRIVSAGQDKAAQVWDATDGGNAFIYSGHTNVVRSAAWSRNGKRIASGSWDKTVQVWQVG
jgi:WD40 repeat protein/tRNA A-37 threonylcarbamoyl transferase component Bud32